MSEEKEVQEENMIKEFLSNKKALELLKKTSEQDSIEIMKYGVSKYQSKTPFEMAQDFIKLATLYPNVIQSRDISKIISKIDLKEEEE
ncbi:hypothetical protein [Sulfurimonas hydrogeniphila]|uniref:hypothetical protein n=1 Tax=Sulfurimonas hydrogeniphila TaxID=2509341 RepID=UPI00125EB811|nr:hypothetical protein [Sulfurimonas hydrogeniphila]